MGVGMYKLSLKIMVACLPEVNDFVGWQAKIHVI
jgi:hypothetical protein